MKIGVNLDIHRPFASKPAIDLDDLERFAAEVRPLVTSPGAELCSALH